MQTSYLFAMKNTVFTLLLGLIVFVGKGQSLTTKIYFAKNGAQTLGPLEIYTMLNPDQPIIVRNNSYVLLETDADSLGFIKRSPSSDADNQFPVSSTYKSKPVFIKFERGKSYFFKLGPIVYSQHLDVEEMSERAFWMYVSLNDLGDKQKTYFLSNSNGLTKGQQ